MASKPLPPLDLLHQLLSYDPDTGELTWKCRPASMFSASKYQKIWNAKNAGKQAGSISANGYRVVRLRKENYKAHVLCWLLAEGYRPAADIDHINGLRSDNRRENLRSVDRRANAKNTKISPRNKTGSPGVQWRPVEKRWQARISDRFGRRIHLGYFTSLEEAREARSQAETKHGYHANHGRE